MRDAFRTWKRYRGGETPPIWLVDLEDYSHVEIPHENASDTAPVWMGDEIYFLSDRGGVMSLFRYRLPAGEVTEVQRNGSTDIDSLAGGHGRLAYASGGYVFLYDVEKNAASRVAITVPEEEKELASGPKNVTKEVRAVVLSPDGMEVAVEAHGEILVGRVSEPSFRNVSRSPGSAERSPAWSPDGRSLAYFSDASGEYRLQAGGAVVPLPDTGLGYQLRYSPDGTKLAFIDRFRRLQYVDLPTGSVRVVEGVVDPGDAYAWSPDSRSIAYLDLRPTLFRNLVLHSVDSGDSLTLTDGIGDAGSPAFGPEGKHLFFLGSTSAGKVKTGLDLSVEAHRNDVTWSVYQVSPPAGAIERLPIPAALYVDLKVGADGALFLGEDPTSTTFAGKRRLRRFDPDDRELTTVLPEVDEFALSADGSRILHRSGDSWGVVGAGTLDLSALEVQVDPAAEWRQMFREAWRAQRDFFYDENVHGVDWEAMRERYESYLPDLRHRSDLDYVLAHLVGELVNSHISIAGPPSIGPRDEDRPSVGLLGADYEVADGRYRVKRIVRGSYWDEVSSPLTAVGVEEGDYILEVDGRELKARTSLYSLFAGTAGKPTTLRVNGSPRFEGSRVVTVTPLESEAALRRRSWIERNRKRVDELSKGRIAYVYQPDTSSDSLVEFDRYFFPQSNRQALILDERFNDGGGDPDYQLDVLDRQQVHWYRNRNEAPFKSPFHILSGPKVMLVNAEAGSGGDVYPYQFKIRGLGEVVGTRTWGGVQGGGAGPGLIDGGSARVPNLGTWSPDGEYILENEGFTPDIEVQVFPRDDFAGRDPQLERAVEMILDELVRRPPPPMPSLETVDRSRKEGSSRRD
jgi:tricorn protease